MNKIAYYLILLVGTVTCLQFLPHAFLGYPAVLEHIAKGKYWSRPHKGCR